MLRSWREGSPEGWFDPEQYPSGSILLHPVIWAYPDHDMSTGMRHYLDHFRVRARQQLQADDVWVD
jgi:hypothetical protein